MDLLSMSGAEYHAYLEAQGHRLVRDEDGEIDVFVLDCEYHNGPGCELCGESWCHHCRDEVDACECAK